MIVRLLCGIVALAVLSACRFGAPSELVLSFSAYTERPMVLIEMTVNGRELTQVPAVIRGRADSSEARFGSNRQLLSYPPGDGKTLRIDTTWVELPEGTAYSGTASIDLDAIASGKQASALLVLAPGGTLIVATDPPKGNARDLIQLCGSRTPEWDANYRADPGQLPGLREAMAAARADPVHRSCGGSTAS